MFLYFSKRAKKIIQFQKNVWNTRYWWMAKYKVDPPFLSANQKLLHQNEYRWHENLAFLKERSGLLYQGKPSPTTKRCAVMTVASFSQELKPPALEFVFKGKGQRVTASLTNKVDFLLAEKGCYQVQHMLEYINRLATIPVAFFPEKHVIFTFHQR